MFLMVWLNHHQAGSQPPCLLIVSYQSFKKKDQLIPTLSTCACLQLGNAIQLTNGLNWFIQFFFFFFWGCGGVGGVFWYEMSSLLKVQRSFCVLCGREQKVLAQKNYCIWALRQEPFYMTTKRQAFFFFFICVFTSFRPTLVFQLFSLRTLCLRHDSKLSSPFVMTQQCFLSGIFWRCSTILPLSSKNCLFYSVPGLDIFGIFFVGF